MLQHEGSVAVSSLHKEDLLRFEHRDVSNDTMFIGCFLDPADLGKIDAVQRSVEGHIKLYACMMPYHIIQRKCEEVERGSWKIRKAKIYVKGSLYN